jgi:hypothetical protein
MTTIAELLFDDPRNAVRSIREQIDRVHVVDALPQPVATVSHLGDQLAEAIGEFVHMPVGNLLFSAFDKHRAITDACAQTRGKPGATAAVVVAEHTLTSSQRPQVEIDVAGKDLELLELVLTVTLHLQMLTVMVTDGQVVGYSAGEADSNAELGIARAGGEAYVLVHKELPQVTLTPWRARPVASVAATVS